MLLILFIGLLNAAEPLAANDHCVQYVTEKTMLMLRKVEVTGKACTISAEVVAVKNRYRVQVEFEHSQFQSGKVKRDADISEYLGGKQSPTIRVETTLFDRGTFEAWLVQSEAVVLAELKVKGQAKPVQMRIRFVKSGSKFIAVNARVETSFSQLGLTPPEVVGGAVAKVHDPIVLEAQLQIDKVKNADVLLSGAKK